MKQKAIGQAVTRFLVITVGSVLYAAGIAFFLDPGGLVTGGLTGISMIVSRFIPVNTGLLVLVLNIPLLVAGFFVFGRGFLFSTVYATVSSSLLIWLFEHQFAAVLPFTEDSLMAGLLGGCLLSLGLALVFRCGGTTGGTDVVAKFLRRRFRQLSTGKLFMAMDISIVALSVIVFRKIEPGLYSAISIIAGNILFDKVLYGMDEAKLLYVISREPEKISRRVLQELDAGVTFLSGQGGFTGEEKKVLLIVVKKPLYPRLKDIVREEDPAAFQIVTSAGEVFGEGFKLSGRNSEV